MKENSNNDENIYYSLDAGVQDDLFSHKLFRSVMQDSAENKTNTIKAIKNIRQMNMDKMRNVKMMS